jgi:hypothetical protein
MQVGRWTDGQANIQTGRETDRQIDTHTYIEIDLKGKKDTLLL